MLKGINRNIIVVRTPRTSRFEAAYFILKKEKKSECKEKLLEEANRMIIRGERAKKKRARWIGSALWFLAGAALGAGTAIVISLLI